MLRSSTSNELRSSQGSVLHWTFDLSYFYIIHGWLFLAAMKIAQIQFITGNEGVKIEST
jgi:hypothetical protein